MQLAVDGFAHNLQIGQQNCRYSQIQLQQAFKEMLHKGNWLTKYSLTGFYTFDNNSDTYKFFKIWWTKWKLYYLLTYISELFELGVSALRITCHMLSKGVTTSTGDGILTSFSLTHLTSGLTLARLWLWPIDGLTLTDWHISCRLKPSRKARQTKTKTWYGQSQDEYRNKHQVHDQDQDIVAA